MTLLLTALTAVLAIACLRWPAAPLFVTPLRRLRSIAPVLVALAAITTTWSSWGSLDPPPTVGDEAAYLLQARLLAHGRIAGDAPPIPEFFEQAHVLVTPVLAPKYPIGFGLVLVPGVLLGAAALVPLLLSGLSGALLWTLARRACGTGVALLACAIWLAAPGARYRAGFFSETLTTPLIMLAWYSLLRWREHRRQPWLVAASMCVAGMVITRPLTAIAFAIPLALVIVPDVCRGAWRQATAATMACLPLLSLLVLQNVASGGRWWELPYDRYTRTYIPFDHIGFGVDDRAPLRARPPDLERLAQALKAPHHDFTLTQVPAILVARTKVFLVDLAGPGALIAFLFLAVGAMVVPPEVRFAGASGLLLFAVHSIYAHAPQWSIYYSEALPIAAVLAAAGFAWVSIQVARRFALDNATERCAAVILLAAGIVAWPMPERVAIFRLYLEVSREPITRFQEAIASISGPAIVFVRYDQQQPLHRSLVENTADFSAAPLWIARDRGDENVRLIAMAPKRAAYIYDERERHIVPFDGSLIAATPVIDERMGQ
jgi:hypothetical protein